MTSASSLRLSVLPLLLLASGRTSRCQITTASGTGELLIVGTIDFLEVEAGCWQLIASDGRRYVLQPEGAPDSVLRDGARVRLVGRLSEEPVRGCAMGTAVEVTRGEVLAPLD
jgi:hypothetical protein